MFHNEVSGQNLKFIVEEAIHFWILEYIHSALEIFQRALITEMGTHKYYKYCEFIHDPTGQKYVGNSDIKIRLPTILQTKSGWNR